MKEVICVELFLNEDKRDIIKKNEVTFEEFPSGVKNNLKIYYIYGERNNITSLFDDLEIFGKIDDYKVPIIKQG